MFQFRNKTVFIISPEPWGKMKVSKHHYALELAEQNCRVYFIEPPQLHHKNIAIKSCADHPMISIISYKPIFRAKRILPSFLFSLLVKQQVNILLKKINVQPDIVWCFQGYLFQNLQWFGAKVNIFFGADLFYYQELPPEIDSANLSLAVSDTIFEKMNKSGKPVFMIGHGLQKDFVKGAMDLLENDIALVSKKKITAGYVGNLRMEALDRATIMKVIQENPEVHFIFWGSYQSHDLNLGGLQNKDTDAFISFLEHQKNVELRGAIDSRSLQEQLKEADMLWICWQIGINHLWDGSNSHKLLEYLSTGKPVVAHYVSSYKNTNFLYMLSEKENSGYNKLFQQVVEIVKKGESKKLIEKRLELTIEHSYTKQLIKIEQLINETLYSTSKN